MIKQISATNFKSWEDTGPMRLAPITGLFGSNSSGKTSLIQLFLMLKQTSDSPDRSQVFNLGDERSLVELGTFQELVYSHNLDNEIRIDIEWDLPEELKVEDPRLKGAILFQGASMGFTANVAWAKAAGKEFGKAEVRDMRYRFAGAEFGMTREAGKRNDFDLVETDPKFSFTRVIGRPWKLPPPAKFYGFPDQVRAYYQNASFLSDLELQFDQLFSRIFYLGPLREYPKRQYQWSGAQPDDMGRRGERVVEALLASRDSGVVFSRGRGVKRQNLEQRVAWWLKELGLIHSFEVRPITEGGKLFQVWVRRQQDAPEVLITDVGFGVSQILPVITLCYYVPEGSTIILEQPEIHLHPKVQAGLADVFVEVVKQRRIQIILESHSEHLLRRLQVRMAEDKIGKDDASLYFCAVDGGRSKLIELDLDIFGNIRNWPKDFFGDEMGEISAMQKAIIERKSKGAE
jgi:predicted ATPase